MVQRKVKTARLILLSVLLAGAVLEMEAQRRPLIGVADASKDGKNAAVPRSYIDAVLQAGGIPVVIPTMYDEKKVIELLNTVDGIIFAGGGDFDPAYYNERPITQTGKINVSRDEFEMKLVYLAAERSMPILGICRGLQLINIAFGGSLYQDLPTQYDDKRIRHRQKQPNDEASHAVYVEPHTVFSGIVKDRRLMVNSSHHQAIKKVAHGFRVAGKSPDNIVEVIEKVDDNNWILGVQFHPEARVTQDHAMHLIFQRFIDEAGRPEKSEQTVKTASALQAGHKSKADSQVLRAQIPEPGQAPPQVMHKSVIDTLFIYKYVRDTQYIQAPADTVYQSVSDIKYVQLPTDTVYVRDTVYIAVSPKANRTSPVSRPLPVSDKSASEGGKSTSSPVAPSVKLSASSDSPVPVSETTSVPVVDQSAIGAHKMVSDTLIFTPGTLDSAAVSTQPKTSRSKKKEEKREKKAAEKQQKEQIAKARQQEKAQKEKKAQEKKAAEEQQRQQQKEQIAKARQQEKVQKEKKAQEKKAAEEQQQQQQKEQIAKARQQEKAQKEKKAQEKKAAEEQQQQQQKEQIEKARQQKQMQKEKEAQEKKTKKE